MARIAGSVYGAVQPQKFHGRAGQPSEMMKESILWRMHGHKYDPRVAPLEKFAEAYTTTNRMVRIYNVLGVSKARTGAPSTGRGTRRPGGGAGREERLQADPASSAAARSGWGRFEKL